MSDKDSPRNRPVVLRPDNFTPPERTPWGGERILASYKDGLRLQTTGVVGESWEVSVEPDFPALVDGSASEAPSLEGVPLADVIARDPAGWLGAEAALGGSPLLVKLLDAATPLSVQIHPADDDPALGPGESGKPESWLVVEADEGAGLYLGLQPGVDEGSMRRAIEAGDDVSALLPFVPVAPGDFFLIEAGTPHAIGGGVTLVEPQRVLPGKRGLTYRYWDWNRRYDEQGQPDEAGDPRELHVDAALRVTRWSLARGDALLPEVRVRSGAPALEEPATLQRLCGPTDAALTSETLEVGVLAGSGPLILGASEGFRALTVIAGALTIDGLRLERGRSAALPADQAHQLQLDRAWAVVSRAMAGA